MPVTDPSVEETLGVAQLSEADADPSARLISDADGLQPSVVVVPFALTVGAVLSVTVTVLVHGAPTWTPFLYIV